MTDQDETTPNSSRAPIIAGLEPILLTNLSRFIAE